LTLTTGTPTHSEGFILSARQRALLPTDEDVAHYREHGWYLSPPILTPDEIAAARKGVARHQAGERDMELTVKPNRKSDWHEGDEVPLRINDYVGLTNRELGLLVRHPLIGATAARLAATPEVRLWQSGIVYKDPCTSAEETEIGWHTDRAYWQSCSSLDMLTAWIPLQSCDESMGTLTLLDGSHRWERTDDVNALLLGHSFRGPEAEAASARLTALGRGLTEVPVVAEQGQVSFHNCFLLHRSGPNRSPQPRIAITLDMQPRDNHFREPAGPGGNRRPHSNDALCRRTPEGIPDYTDPRVFPALWREGMTDGDGAAPL
jgi:ectoine hydroxylase-related dioxygenase (phytanoyl-CoA dioxygenase family)